MRFTERCFPTKASSRGPADVYLGYITVILTMACRRFVVQVSDRLVTDGGREHDRLANKTALFQATDGLFAISYAGPANFKDLPTDVWIAQTLYGKELGRPDSEDVASSTSGHRGGRESSPSKLGRRSGADAGPPGVTRPDDR